MQKKKNTKDNVRATTAEGQATVRLNITSFMRLIKASPKANPGSGKLRQWEKKKNQTLPQCQTINVTKILQQVTVIIQAIQLSLANLMIFFFILGKN